MRKLVLTCAQSLALMPIFGYALAFDVHGIRIGDRWDPDKLEEAMSYVTVPIAHRVKCRDDGQRTCAGTTRYLVADVQMVIEGENGRVRKITMALATGEFENEIAALKREFGRPDDDWSAPPDAATPLLFHRRVDWRLPDEELFALRFSVMATISLTRPEDSPADRYPPPI